MADRYLEAARRIPLGETRSFLELAAMAGRPGAARAAGRAVRACAAASAVPWHRVVAADGKLAVERARAATQLARLRREGARPRRRETIRAWCRRRSIALVGRLPRRVFLPADDARLERWDALRVEPLADEAAARARGFRPLDDTVDAPDEARRRGPRRPRARRAAAPLAARLDALDWARADAELLATGCWAARGVLAPAECEAVLAESERAGRFDREVEMLAKGYGVGRYRYWNEPLPEPLGELREALYPRLRPCAEAIASGAFPATLAEFWRRCREAGQQRPSSILIQYPTRGVNHPHRDLYGRVWFPLQALVVLSRRGRDFEGGEFVLIEERPGQDLRRAVPVSEGDLVVFCTRERRERSGGRRRKVALLHAMDPVTRGEREAAGIVFHLAG